MRAATPTTGGGTDSGSVAKGEPPFDHIVLTRFNVRLPGREPVSDDWLRDRLALFDRTMLPSMLGQTVRPTAWLLLCDHGSPRWFRDALADRLAGIGETVWLDRAFAPESSPEVAAEVVRSRITKNFLITTRVDCDDCVSARFLESVQDHFDGTHAVFLNFTWGIQYQDGWVFRRSDPSNAFISLCERTDSGPVRTVFVDGHDRLSRHGKIRQLRGGPLWMQVVHGGNISNAVHGIRTKPEIVDGFVHQLPLRPFHGLKPRLQAASDAMKLGLRVISKPHRLVWLWNTIAGR